jgi:hypothetical protein
MNGQQTHPHQARYYIIMTTLVIGGIFFLLLMNNDQNEFSLTGSTVGIFKNESGIKTPTSNTPTDQVEKSNPYERALTKEIAKGANEFEVELSFDQIPKVKKEAKVKEILLNFDDLSTIVNVNKDKLELNNLEEVSLSIQGFIGNLDFDSTSFSLNGNAKRLEVNGVSLSSKNKIDISFEDVNYNFLSVEDIEIKELEMENGDGILKAAEKLSYALEQDSIKFYEFNGEVEINKENSTLVNLRGVAGGLGISGALLNINLH